MPHHHHHGEMMHHGHDEAFYNRPNSHVMFHHVETACAADVEHFCREPPRSQFLSTGDPFLDWIFSPFAPPPPELQDITKIMDRLFDPQFLEPSRDYVTLFFVQEPQHVPHFLIDSATTKAAQELEPQEIPQLANDLQKYGNEILSKLDDDSSMHYKMARRLTEMDAKTIQHHVSLPFGCAKNQCLRRALQEGRLSPGCQSSIERLESTFSLEVELEQRQELFLGMMLVYLFTLVVLAILIRRKMGSLRSSRRLGELVLQAVYSNPATKRQVELDLGQSVGSMPPVLRLGVRVRGEKGFMQRVRVAVLAILVAMAVFAPFWVLPVCILLSCVRVIRIWLFSTQTSNVTCPCCGANSADVLNGNLIADQDCCSCCMGTGDCALSCADCRGPTAGSDGSSCSTEDYRHPAECPIKGRGEKHVVGAKHEVFCGVPIQIV